jgi:hypothetical protein
MYPGGLSEPLRTDIPAESKDAYLLLRAINFANIKHRKQKRKDPDQTREF